MLKISLAQSNTLWLPSTTKMFQSDYHQQNFSISQISHFFTGNYFFFSNHVIKRIDQSPIKISFSRQRTVMYIRLLRVVSKKPSYKMKSTQQVSNNINDRE